MNREKKIDWKELGEKVFKVWKKVVEFFKKVWDEIRKWKILKWVGLLVAGISVLLAFIETISVILGLFDRVKFNEILKYLYDVDLLKSVSNLNYNLIMLGGYAMDMSVYLLLIIFGFWLFNHKKVKRKKFLCVALIFFVGLASFLVGFYKSMPQILVPLEKISKQIESQNETPFKDFNETNRGKWKIHKRQWDNGFEERGYYDTPNEKRYYRIYENGF